MKKSKIILINTLIVIMLLLNMQILIGQANATSNISVPASYENFSMGGGGTFYYAKVNPKNKNNYVAISDMGGIYYTFDAGKNWGRTEGRGISRELDIDKNGVIFTGSYGLYKSIDGGKSIELIYPKKENVLYSISRAGWSENLMLAEDYDNGYIKSISSTGEWIYFITQDWEGNFKLIKCDYNGNNLSVLFNTEFKSVNPTSEITCKIIPDEYGVYFSVKTSNHNSIYYYDYKTKSTKIIFSTDGLISDFKKIDDVYFILNDKENSTEILYTKNFIDFKKLNDFNNLENIYKFQDYSCEFEWHFKEVSGNNFNNIFISFTSKNSVDWGTLEGIIHFNGYEFKWVYGDVENRNKSNDDIGWSYGGIGPIYSINISPNEESKLLVTNPETVIDIEYNPKENIREVHTLHNQSLKDGFYTSTGLNLQTTYGVFEDPFNSKNMLVATTDLGLQISHDGGKSFRRMKIEDKSYAERMIYNTCYDLYFDKKNKDVVYGLWSSVHDAPYVPSTASDSSVQGKFGISLDGGLTWNFEYSKGLPINSIPVKMSVKETEKELIIAVATFNKGFYISFDSGKTFKSINQNMENYNGFIWGEDIIINNDNVYCLASHHSFGGDYPAKLYEYNISNDTVKNINLSNDIKIARNLATDKNGNIYISVIPWFKGETIPEIGKWFFVNYGGGVYKYNGETVSLYFENTDGIYDCDFDEDGNMYAVSVYGQVFYVENGKSKLYADGMFNQLKNISFSNDKKTLYISTFGGGTYRMPTMKKLIEENQHIPSIPDNDTNNKDITNNTTTYPKDENNQTGNNQTNNNANNETSQQNNIENNNSNLELEDNEAIIPNKITINESTSNNQVDVLAPGIIPQTGENYYVEFIIMAVIIINILIIFLLRKYNK